MFRAFAVLVCLFTCLPLAAQSVSTPKVTNHEYDFQNIIYKAEDLAKKAFTPPSQEAPAELKGLNYQQYRSIRFIGEKALWKGESNFEVQLFHPGFLYQQQVEINQILTNSIANIPFSTDMFRYDGQPLELSQPVKSSLNFSGFRIHYPLNNQTYKDELIVFQGASYFRPLGPGQVYGLSARGLAIDTGEPSGEEFPYFKEFWLVKPQSTDTSMTMYALLDSQSMTGAYKFELLPGIPTRINVKAELFPRQTIKKLGIAPLTSMFFYGENRVRHFDDFRPEVHDSDGLLIATRNGEWIWRPLSNPNQLRFSSFSLQNPVGFGLMQRDTNFDHYQDLEAKYHQRPSIWIEPQGLWNKGRVELVEIPTPDETNDNIVAYWVPDFSPQRGQQISLDYKMSIINEPTPAYLGKVKQTRIGWGGVPGQSDAPPQRQRLFVVDFDNWPENMTPQNIKVKAKVESSTGEVFDVQTTLLPDNKTWRASFKVSPEGNIPADITLHLRANDQRITETWSYVWYPSSLDK